jgi:hypothetical protein
LHFRIEIWLRSALLKELNHIVGEKGRGHAQKSAKKSGKQIEANIMHKGIQRSIVSGSMQYAANNFS